MSNTFGEFLISRLMMGIIGGGFVVGIKMIAEWFPPEKMGIAQGIYAGWGNFGAAAAAFSLPLVAILFSEDIGWRMATGLSGVCCLIWSGVYYKFSKEIPARGEQFKLSLINAITVNRHKDLVLLCLLMIPVYGAVAFFIWKLARPPINVLSPGLAGIFYALVIGLYIASMIKCLRTNLPRLVAARKNGYEFSQVFILSLVYALTFGSQLAVISMFPEFLDQTFELSVTMVGILGSSFSVLNLITRPGGGWLSDKFGRRRILFIMVIGAMIGYVLMGQISEHWSLVAVIILSLLCSAFLQAGNGACFAAVPLIKQDMTGKFAGIIGSYGNIGAVFFLTTLSFVSEQTFFNLIALYALLVLGCLFFLKSFEGLPATTNTRTACNSDEQ
jgi:NNP family nitrate/nitrite transporter-like MFS transporter